MKAIAMLIIDTVYFFKKEYYDISKEICIIAFLYIRESPELTKNGDISILSKFLSPESITIEL